MKVYIITAGCYSDYHIIGATLKEGVAKRFVQLHNGKDDENDLDYETYDLDDFCQENRKLWCLHFDKDGNINDFYCNGQVIPGTDQKSYVSVDDYTDNVERAKKDTKRHDRLDSIAYWEERVREENGNCTVVFWADERSTKKDRVKIASEFRREALAHWSLTGETTYYIQGSKKEEK